MAPGGVLLLDWVYRNAGGSFLWIYLPTRNAFTSGSYLIN